MNNTHFLREDIQRWRRKMRMHALAFRAWESFGNEATESQRELLYARLYRDLSLGRFDQSSREAA